MRVYENGIYRDLTSEEITAMQTEAKKAEVAEKSRPLTEYEVSRMLLTAQINTLSVDDNMSLRMKEFYPNWAENTEYTAGYKVQYNGKLWRCISAHTSIVGWIPSIATASMWEEVNETHNGTMDDPIPYDGNMTLESGKYYIQNGAIYLCNRDTVNPVYQPLAELVGLFVEVI